MSDADRVLTTLKGLVRSTIPHLDYLALYPAKAVAQNPDGSLELIPDDNRLPGMSHVPMRMGANGTTCVVTPGTRLLVGFDGGDATKPYTALWEPSNFVSTIDFAVLGTAFMTALDALLLQLNAAAAALVAAGPQIILLPSAGASVASAGATIAAAIAAFNAAKTAYHNFLSAKLKVSP